jgi:transposase
MPMLAEPLDVVIGVDTHKHTHTAAAVSLTGAVIDHLTVPSGPKSYRRLIVFGDRH